MCGYFSSFYHLLFSVHPPPPVPCCPQDVAIDLVSTETLEIMWSPVKGAELYETTAAETKNIIHCNDTAPVCVLSDLKCNTAYSVTVTPCSDLRGCNYTCKPLTHETGTDGVCNHFHKHKHTHAHSLMKNIFFNRTSMNRSNTVRKSGPKVLPQ